MNCPWDKFAREKLAKIFNEKYKIIDIGGGLRVDNSRSNRLSPDNLWLADYLAKVDYKVLDKVEDFHPDIIGDIHQLPFADNSIDAIICIAVLEHVENPIQAMSEIHRVLKIGGYAYIYVPFLYYYHPLANYYQDFYRFTYDGVRHLTKNFHKVEIQNVRGALATIFNLLPFFSKRTAFLDRFDKLLGKQASKQTSGYNIFCVK